MPNVKQAVRDFAVAIIRKFGSELVDYKTGQSLGRALLIPWRGKVHVIGLGPTIRPVFLPQKRLTYWKQELGFTVHPPVDYPNERDAARDERAAS